MARHGSISRDKLREAEQRPIPVVARHKDALFVGSTYGPEGITVAVRIGFDDNRSLGPKETGGMVAIPVFREIMLKVYR
jgi:membrane carboxypeptidase/penicillin-binding protein